MDENKYEPALLRDARTGQWYEVHNKGMFHKSAHYIDSPYPEPSKSDEIIFIIFITCLILGLMALGWVVGYLIETYLM